MWTILEGILCQGSAVEAFLSFFKCVQIYSIVFQSRESARKGATKVARSQGMVAAYFNIAAILFALLMAILMTGLVIGLYGETWAFNKCYRRGEWGGEEGGREGGGIGAMEMEMGEEGGGGGQSLRWRRKVGVGERWGEGDGGGRWGWGKEVGGREVGVGGGGREVGVREGGGAGRYGNGR